jgi:subtilase family serine protease
MRRVSLVVFILSVAVVFLLLLAKTSAQSGLAERRISQAVDESRLTILRGNTHPSARPQADQGAAPPDLPMERMLLVLKPSADQQAALSKLLSEQQDRSSPNYHKWLTPNEFGQQFGASEDDIQTISSWLESHGFRIDQVTPGRTLVQFSGTASSVNEAFHTEIHKYVVKGEQHWANASDPQIPSALTPVVAGVNTLHNFRRHPMSHRVGTFTRNRATGEVRALQSQFTLGTGCGLQNGNCYLVGPGDFAKIYNVPTAATGGAGVTIGIVGDSRINIADAQNFYALFGVVRSNPTVTIATGGTDPGLNGDETEADIDTQWAGAVAPGAAINLVISADSNAALGVDIAAESIVNSGGAEFQILSESFGTCETSLGSAGNQMFGGNDGNGGLWGQAASEGITVVISAGDSGSAGCENPTNEGATTPPQPAITGLAVSGLASTWNNIAVGGTDFDQFSNTSSFWNLSNTANTQVSVKGYIPETTWNDSCTNILYTMVSGFGSTAQANCNDTSVVPSFIVPQGGGGGPSGCAIFAGANCMGYTKPPYQTALTTPLDTFRDVPDVSLFAGTGTVGSFYPVCQQDQNPGEVPCSLASPGTDIMGVGGTSVSTQAFAGIVALIDQHKGGPQGRINDRIYALAGIAGNMCTSASNEAAACIFNDVVAGTNAQPCVNGSPDCSETTTANAVPFMRNVPRATSIFVVLACVSFFGALLLGFRLKNRNWSSAFALLVFALFMTCAACGGGSSPVVPPAANGILTGFNAGASFDEATGLGSVNVGNLIDNF